MLEGMAGKELERKTAAEIRAEERARRTNTDRQILKNARLSYAEISEKTGVPVHEIGERLERLLQARDHLTERQEERLLIIEMGDHIDEMKQRADAASDQFYGDIAAVILRGYDSIAKRLDMRRKATELDIAEITRAQGEMFLSILNESINMAATRLEELHPDLEFDIREELEEAFSEVLPFAAAEVQRKVRE